MLIVPFPPSSLLQARGDLNWMTEIPSALLDPHEVDAERSKSASTESLKYGGVHPSNGRIFEEAIAIFPVEFDLIVRCPNLISTEKQ